MPDRAPAGELADSRASAASLPMDPLSAGFSSSRSVPTSSFKPAAMTISTGFLHGNTLEEAAEPQSPQIVCTQAGEPQLSSSNAFDRLSFSSAAIKSVFSHDNMVKMGRNFVPGQPLPDAPSYVALTSRQKFDLFLHRSYSAGIFTNALFDSLYSQATGAYPSFGGGMAGYGHRFAASMAGSEAASFLGTFLFPTLLHQDPRYFRSHQEETSSRLAYAASRAFIGRSDDGRSVINSSLILSQFAEAALSNAYIPYRNESVSGTVENALAGIGGVIQSNILEEFWPDIKAFLERHEPKSVHHWQDRWDNSSLAKKYPN